jgi:hypothetical protein
VTDTSGDRFGEGDGGIVNYALTLEYVEEDFYKRVVASGLVKGRALDLVKRIGQNESEHVDALSKTSRKLGGKPPVRPHAAP